MWVFFKAIIFSTWNVAWVLVWQFARHKHLSKNHVYQTHPSKTDPAGLGQQRIHWGYHQQYQEDNWFPQFLWYGSIILLTFDCQIANERFLLYADMSCRGRLAGLNEKLTRLERKIEYLEARVSFLPIQFFNEHHFITFWFVGDKRWYFDVSSNSRDSPCLWKIFILFHVF